MTELSTAPVVLLGYRRPELTARVFASIRAARPSTLILVMDGPKPGDVIDAKRVADTRLTVERVDWDCAVHRFYARENMGLKRRVSSGLDEAFSIVDQAIILEDDCLPSPDFFPFATELLHRYASDERVGIVSGSQRLRGARASEYSYDFSADVRIWGWATWARTWRGFSESGDLEATFSPEAASELSLKFAKGARRKSMRSMMASIAQLDSWALPFAIHCVEKGYVNPVASANLISNVGFGELSTHTSFESYVAEVSWEPLHFPLQPPPEVCINSRFDALESRSDLIQLWTYPIKHPLDVAARFRRYLLSR